MKSICRIRFFMNNHGIICKNNTMIIFLLVLGIIIFILLNQKVKFHLNFSVLGLEYYFCVSIHYFFEITTLYKEDFVRYRQKAKQKKKQTKKKWELSSFDVERIQFEMRVGMGDPFVTSMVIPFLATMTSILLQKYFAPSSKQFSIRPVPNRFFFSTKGAVSVSIKLKDLLKFFV